MRFICNAFSINMLSNDDVSVVFRKLTEDDQILEMTEDAVCCIGHRDLLAVVQAQFPTIPNPKTDRPTVSVTRGDELLVAQYRGPRLPEGTTQLPEGATIEWWYVHVG